MLVNQTPTIGTVRDQHLSLMREWRELKTDNDRVRMATDMRRIAAEAGRNIESAAERDEAQGIIDYWASAIAALEKHSYPELLSVAPYTARGAVKAGKSLREAFEELSPPEAQRIARSILEDLFVLVDQKVERGPPRSREALRRAAGTTNQELFDRVIQSLVDTGAIVCRPDDKSTENDCYEAVDGRIADTWDALKKWLVAAQASNADRSTLMEQAEQWEKSKHDPALLLSTRAAVDKALPYQRDDDLLSAYIGASLRQRNQLRHLVQAGSAVLLVILAVAAFYYWSLAKRTQAKLDQAHELFAQGNAYKRATGQLKTEAQEDASKASADAAIATQAGALNTTDFKKSVEAIDPGTQSAATSGLDKLPALNGAMWLGSDKTPQVSDLKGGSIGSFVRVAPGARYRARVQIYLRDAMPTGDADYGAAKQKAIIPAGAQIVLLSPPRAFQRSNGTQYWAQVRVVPQVYVQYNNASKAQADKIRRTIAAAGFEVPVGELRRDYLNHAEIRYLQPSDAAPANVLQRTLNSIPELTRAGEVDCRLFAGAPAGWPNFKLEFWFDARRAPGSSRGRPCR